MKNELLDFLAFVPPPAMPTGACRAAFLEMAGVAANLELELGDRSVWLMRGPHTSVGSDPAGQVTLVLFGDVLEAGPDPATALACRYAALGPAFARDVHGSWSGVLIDCAKN